jgi:hypothetical protein
MGSYLTDATRSDSSRRTVRIFAAMLQPERDAAPIIAADLPGGPMCASIHSLCMLAILVPLRRLSS